MVDFDCGLDSIFLDVIDLDRQESEPIDNRDLLQLQDWCLEASEPVITFEDSLLSTDIKKWLSSASVPEDTNALSTCDVSMQLVQKYSQHLEFGEGCFDEPMVLYQDRNELQFAKPLTAMSGIEASSDRGAHNKLTRVQRRQSEVYKKKEKARRQREKMRRSILRSTCIALEADLRHRITQARHVGSQISRCVLERWWKQSDGAIQAYRVLFTRDWIERVNLIEKEMSDPRQVAMYARPVA